MALAYGEITYEQDGTSSNMFQMIAQWLNSQTIAQNGEIQKQLNNTPNRNYKNYRSCFV